MDKYAREIVAIAKQLEEIEASERQAGLFDIFKTKMSQDAAGNVEDCLKGLQSNIEETFSTWIVGDMSYIKKKLSPLRKTQAEGRDGKGLANFYTTFAEWFMKAYKALDPGIKNFFKSKKAKDVLDLMKNWASEEGDKKQISKKLEQLMRNLDNQIKEMIKKTKDLGIGLNLQDPDDIKTLNKLLNVKVFDDAASSVTPQVTETPAAE